MTTLDRIADGRTDLVFEYLEEGNAATERDSGGVSLVEHCFYYGDVSAIKFLLSHGASLEVLGNNLRLDGASFHGHWRLVQFLVERGANVNLADEETGETPLHAALCSTRKSARWVVKVLLDAGAKPNVATRVGAETGGFMRDVRTRGESPLHRAAAFAEEETIDLLIGAGASREVRDANGDTPLSWASWHLRPTPILRKLLFGDFRIHPKNRGMDANLLGEPHV